MFNRKVLTGVIAALAVLAGSASALAHAPHHSHHARRVAGVVVAINSSQHTLTLRIRHGHRLSAADARGGLVTISFGDAEVSGPDGAVAVGDSVSCMLSESDVASAIRVIGEPNGGEAGEGAAIPGLVTAVDKTDGTLTLAAGSDAGPSLVTVSVNASTVLAINGDDAPSLSEISVGDHVVVFTDDMSASPIVAIAILDSGMPGDGSGDGAGGSGASGDSGPTGTTGTRASGVAGVVTQVGDNSLTLTVNGDGPYGAQTVTVDFAGGATFQGTDGTGETVTSLDQVEVGDHVGIYTTGLDSLPLTGTALSDQGNPSGGTSPSGGDSGQWRFGGIVTDVRGDGLTVTGTSDGPLKGMSVIVAIRSTTSFETPAGTGTGTSMLADIAVGDPVEIDSESASTATPIVATEVIDDSAPTGSE
jgi:hypothetical protein